MPTRRAAIVSAFVVTLHDAGASVDSAVWEWDCSDGVAAVKAEGSLSRQR